MPKSPSLARKLRKKYTIIFYSAALIIPLIFIKYFIIEPLGLSIITLNNLVTAFLGGVFFTIGILFAGAATDFKEAEKMPGELATLLKSLYKDTVVIPTKALYLENIRTNIQDLLAAINSNFLQHGFKLKEIDIIIDKIYSDMGVLSRNGVPLNYLIKMGNELTAIDRIAHRIDVIKETTFIPAAYTIAEISVGSMLFILMLLKTEPAYESIIILVATSIVLISLLILIKDMDNPFRGFATVDLEVLFSLESYWKKQGPKIETDLSAKN